MPGFVSLVGVGPGDPGLLTLRGRRAIAAADTLLVDALVHPGVLRHARPDAEQLFVGKRGDQSSTGQEEINHMLLLRASQGRRVARLKGGDALIFGRGAEEAEFLAEHGIAFEVIPGVSAAIGATAYAGIPLTHREHSSSVALVTSRERPGRPADQGPLRAVASADTIVIFMGLRRLATDLATLIDSGRDPSTPAAIISAGTHPEQVVVTGTLADLPDRAATADVRSPALVVIGEVVRLRERLRWWDGPGLHGRRVLVARAAEQSAETADAFVDLGATVVEIPMIRVGDPSRPEELSVALRAMAAGRYDVVAFTSANGVRRTFAALRSLGLDARAFGRARVAAVGPETARALSDSGITADAVAAEHRGVAVVDALASLPGIELAGCTVLLPRAEVASPGLSETLRARGAAVDDVPAYRTLGPSEEDRERLRDLWSSGGLDAVLLTSGSTARGIAETLGDALLPLPPGLIIASLGPTTSEVARSLGMPVHVEAAVYTLDGLRDALRDHYRQGAFAPP
ncbi:MAG: uroporphyrinogen-III C-methyltransferase [Deltaproteobacteria bacterium]|nr:uroporphyrinogen-III C-methyltransferase [Deltaproteobacteria bacterium]